MIIVGHTRFKAAQKLGLERIPVVVASHLTSGQVRAYRIADNKTYELAEWNYDLLPIEIDALKEANYDLGLLGFDAEELAKIMGNGIEEGLRHPSQGRRIRKLIFPEFAGRKNACSVHQRDIAKPLEFSWTSEMNHGLPMVSIRPTSVALPTTAILDHSYPRRHRVPERCLASQI